MKKKIPSWAIILIGIAAIFAVIVVMEIRPNKEKKKLKEIAEYVNSKCPVAFGDYGIITSCNYKNDEFSITILVDEYYINVDEVKNDKEQVKQDMLLIFVSEKEMRSWIQQIHEANADYIIKYVGNKSGEIFELRINHYEITKALRENKTDPQEALKAHIRVAKRSLPRESEPGLICANVVYDGENVHQYLIVDEEYISMDDLITISADLKDGMIEDFRSSTPMQNELNLMVAAYCGAEYHFIGNVSRKELTISFNWNELAIIQSSI